MISDNQTVRHNYFEGLKGDRNRSALTIMNGVPNSPAHRYNQVINANILNNTFVENSTITFGAGANEELSLAPISSTFSDNLLIANEPNVFVFNAPIDGITSSNNLIDQPHLNAAELSGFEVRSDIEMTRAENGLLYPNDTSDIGIQENISIPSRADTGPIWFSKPDKRTSSQLEADRNR